MTKVRVLVVDDSAFARKVISEVLQDSDDIAVVGIARDGLDALEKIVDLAPDVVTLDLVMPELDGLGVLRGLSERPSRPRVVVVTMSDDQSELGIAALQGGAFELVHKPTAIATDRLYELGEELRGKVRAAARAPSAIHKAPPTQPLASGLLLDRPAAVEILVIGASTGGPQAISRLLSDLPKGLPVPVAIVLHMPVGYTAAFAARLSTDCKLDVVEARQDLLLPPGRVAVARAGMHLRLTRDPVGARASLDVMPMTTPHRPAVDVLFTTAAEAWGPRVLAVVLTGMGNDGVAGARAIHQGGGRVLTETESSCVVYGMPRAVVEAHLSDAEAPIEKMAALIVANL